MIISVLIRSLTASYISIYEWTGNLGQGASDRYMVSRGVTRHILLPDKRMNILPWPRISMSGHGAVFFAIGLASYPYYAAGRAVIPTAQNYQPTV